MGGIVEASDIKKRAQLPEEWKDSNTCPVCSFECASLDELIAHSDSHFNPPKPEPKREVETEPCPVCRKKFAVAELVKHFEQDH